MANGSDNQIKATGKRIAIAIELDHAVPWHHGCYQGITQYAEEHGWMGVADPYLVGMTGQSGIADYDGVVGRIGPEVAEAARDHGIPVVNHWMNSSTKGLPSVFFDYSEGARLAAEHLLMSGYERFALVGITGDAIAKVEYQTFSEIVMDRGYPEPAIFDFPYDFEATREGVISMRGVLTEWLAGLTQPVGIFVQACHAARYIAQICSELGLKVPADIGIVVHLGDDLVVASASPTLSAVDTDYIGLGYESAAFLDELMSDTAPDPQTRLVSPKRIIVRESSDVFLSSDPLVTQTMRYIADHCRQTLRVEDVAEAMNTSRRTLERRFESHVGRPIYAEITRLRIESVKRMLIETDQPLGAIANTCGFSSVSHFTRFFRKATGNPPSQFRKAHRSKAN